MDGDVESFFVGVTVATVVLILTFVFLVIPDYVKHAIKCGTASYNSTTGELVWHDCAAAPEPAPVPLEEAE